MSEIFQSRSRCRVGPLIGNFLNLEGVFVSKNGTKPNIRFTILGLDVHTRCYHNSQIFHHVDKYGFFILVQPYPLELSFGEFSDYCRLMPKTCQNFLQVWSCTPNRVLWLIKQQRMIWNETLTSSRLRGFGRRIATI